MARHPVLITSLEDDFRKIGLIAESAPNHDDAVDVIGEEELDEAGRKQRGRTTKKMSRKARRKQALYRKSGTGKAGMRKQKMRAKKPSVRRKQAKMRAKAIKRGWQKSDVDDPSNGLESLIGEVASLVSAIESDKNESTSNDAVKSWANMAIISEMLGNFFEEIYQEEDDKELEAAFGEAAETFSDLAESAATQARGLSEGQLDEEDEDLQQAFSEHMATLLSGLELYSDIVEEDEDEDDDEDPSED